MNKDVFAEARKQGRIALDEQSGKQLLAAFGIAVPRSVVVRDAGEAASVLATLRPPLVLKVMSPDILHKSDVGGVRTGLTSSDAVAEAIDEMLDAPGIANVRVDGFLVEEMAPAGQEIVVGGVRDPQFGPLVMVGLGGVFVEVLADVAFRICPITRLDAEEMIDELKGAALLKGARGRAPVSRAAIIDVLLKVGGENGILMCNAADIQEADINPVIVSEHAAMAVDARFVLTSTARGERGEERGDNQRTDDRALAPVPSRLSPFAVGTSDSVVDRFKPLFEPRTVAVIGASARGMTFPNIFMRRIREFGFTGAIYPIHPAADAVDGLPAYRSLADTPEPVDYAFIAVPAGQIPPLLRVARGRVRYAQVISSGFSEVDEGKALQGELVAAAREGGMRLIGPNCLGMYSHRGGIVFSETWPEASGHVGAISQSGGIGTDTVRRGITRGIRYSGVVTVGNCADLEPADFVEFYLADGHTRVIGMYVESAGDGRRLFELLREAKARKPIVILKGGRTRLGTMAAASHTGSLAGDDRAWVALSRQTGCVLVETLDEYLDALLTFQQLMPRTQHPTQRVVLFGNGGGASVLATDFFARCGFEVAPFDQDVLDALTALKLPPGTSITNPVDTPVGTLQQDDGGVAEKILEAIYGLARPEALVMHLNLSAFVGRTKADVLGNLMEIVLKVQARYPGQAHFMLVLRADGEPQLEVRKREFRARAAALGIPVYDELDDAARALKALAGHERFVASGASQESPEQVSDRHSRAGGNPV